MQLPLLVRRERPPIRAQRQGSPGGQRRLLAAREGADEFAHQVGEAEGGEEEDEEGFFRGARGRGGAVGEEGRGRVGAGEAGEGGGGEGGGVGGGRAAGEAGEEGAEPAEEGEDAEEGAEGGAEGGELFGDGDHGWRGRGEG